MIGLLRLPPLAALVIVLALAAYLVYRIASTGRVQPLTIIFLAVLVFALVRILFRMRRKVPESEGDE